MAALARALALVCGLALCACAARAHERTLAYVMRHESPDLPARPPVLGPEARAVRPRTGRRLLSDVVATQLTTSGNVTVTIGTKSIKPFSFIQTSETTGVDEWVGAWRAAARRPRGRGG